MSDCEHKYVHMGLQYADGANKLPGSGAVRRYYAHVFFCERCLAKRADRVETEAHNYQKVLSGSVPGDRSVIVPAHDMRYGYC